MKNLMNFVKQRNHTIVIYTGLDGYVCLDAEDADGELVAYVKTRTEVSAEALLQLDAALGRQARGDEARHRLGRLGEEDLS